MSKQKKVKEKENKKTESKEDSLLNWRCKPTKTGSDRNRNPQQCQINQYAAMLWQKSELLQLLGKGTTLHIFAQFILKETPSQNAFHNPSLRFQIPEDDLLAM